MTAEIVKLKFNQNSAVVVSPPGGDNGGGGGGMDDVLRRLGAVEKDVSEIKTQVSGISAVLPHLATKTDVANVSITVSDVKGSIGHLEASLLRWMVATALGIIGAVIAAIKLL